MADKGNIFQQALAEITPMVQSVSDDIKAMAGKDQVQQIKERIEGRITTMYMIGRYRIIVAEYPWHMTFCMN
jgi:hypothetical protein